MSVTPAHAAPNSVTTDSVTTDSVTTDSLTPDRVASARVAFDHRDPGTPECDWDAVSPWSGAEPLDLSAVDAVIVLAAHPDDETLGAGGLLAACAARKLPVHVVVVTDGAASHPDLTPPRDLPRERRREVLDAVADVAPAASITFLGFTDGRVREERAAIARAVRSIRSLVDARRVLITAPWWGDGHRDHRVLGEIALENIDAHTEVVGYPIWLWHWGDPLTVDTTGWRVLALSEAEQRRKQTAVARHRSQLEALSDGPGGEPILHEGMRKHFARATEVFVAAPAGTPSKNAGSVGTAWFDDFFARHDDPWGFESRWYEQRKRSLVLASLPRARFAAALELGCATGVLTQALAERCDTIIGVDAAAAAVRSATERLAARPHVRIEQARLPDQWPEGEFDLVVASEVLYYLDGADRERVALSIRGNLTADGVVVVCHWRHPIHGAPADGDGVHAELERTLGLPRLVRHAEADFVLDVYAADGLSVAEREGLS